MSQESINQSKEGTKKILNPDGPWYKIVSGFNLPQDFDLAEDSLKYAAKENDLFIVTFPKCGTTWTQQIVALILNGGSIADGQVFNLCPFLELVGREVVEGMKQPFAIKTHLPYDLQPKHPMAKYIIVFRNPKDVAVSFYHHHHLIPNQMGKNVSFSQYLKYFMKGEQAYGDYCDWIKSWWPYRNDSNVLFLLYEDMKSDTKGNVLKIASFIGKEYEEKILANDGKILHQIIERSSLESMKKEVNEEAKKRYLPQDEKECTFIRKGIIGDWRNYFTSDENEQFEKYFNEKIDEKEIKNLWNNYNIFGKN